MNTTNTFILYLNNLENRLRELGAFRPNLLDNQTLDQILNQQEIPLRMGNEFDKINVEIIKNNNQYLDALVNYLYNNESTFPITGLTVLSLFFYKLYKLKVKANGLLDELTMIIITQNHNNVNYDNEIRQVFEWYERRLNHPDWEFLLVNQQVINAVIDFGICLVTMVVLMGVGRKFFK